MKRAWRQNGVQLVEALVKQAGDASDPATQVFQEGPLAGAAEKLETLGLDTGPAQSEYIQQLRNIYEKYLAPFHGQDAATVKPPKVVSVPK